MSAMTTPATPLDRAKRAQELIDCIAPGPYTKRGEDMDYWVENAIGERIEDFVDRDRAAFFAETRTLAPALAEDVTQLTALWDLCKPLCQHVPEVAEMARALGLLPAAQPKSEPTIQERLAEAREELARRHAYRQRMINQDAFDGADEAWTSQLEHVRELEAEAAEAGLLPARKEESDG